MMSSERTEGPPAAFFARGDILTIADRDVEFAGKPRPAVALQSPHRAMPNVMLDANQLSNIVAYILSLRQPN